MSCAFVAVFGPGPTGGGPELRGAVPEAPRAFAGARRPPNVSGPPLPAVAVAVTEFVAAVLARQVHKADALDVLVAALTSSDPKPGSERRFRDADVLDMPHVILSMLHCLQQSPVHATYTPSDLVLRASGQTSPAGTADQSLSSAEDLDSDSDSDSSQNILSSSCSELSAWSTDEEDGQAAGGCSAALPDSPGYHGGCSEGEAPRQAVREAAATAVVRKEYYASGFASVDRAVLAFAHLSSDYKRADGVQAADVCNVAAVVANSFNAGIGFRRASPYTTVTESLIVRESIQMLLGKPSDMFYLGTTAQPGLPQQYQFAPVQLLHASPAALRSIARDLTSTGSLLHSIRSFCRLHLAEGSTAGTRTLQAFAGAVLHHLVSLDARTTCWMLLTHGG